MQFNMSAPQPTSELRDRVALLGPVGLAPPQRPRGEYDADLPNCSRCERCATPRAAGYLMGVEAEHMGLGPRADAASRAEATVTAVRDYLASLQC